MSLILVLSVLVGFYIYKSPQLTIHQSISKKMKEYNFKIPSTKTNSVRDNSRRTNTNYYKEDTVNLMDVISRIKNDWSSNPDHNKKVTMSKYTFIYRFNNKFNNNTFIKFDFLANGNNFVTEYNSINQIRVKKLSTSEVNLIVDMFLDFNVTKKHSAS